jgi:hypothetical protein
VRLHRVSWHALASLEQIWNDIFDRALKVNPRAKLVGPKICDPSSALSFWCTHVELRPQRCNAAGLASMDALRNYIGKGSLIGCVKLDRVLCVGHVSTGRSEGDRNLPSVLGRENIDS